MDDIRAYLRMWPEYIGRAFKRLDFILGGLIALIWFALAGEFGLGRHRTAVTVAIVLLSVIETGYVLYREERARRAEREEMLWLDAKITRFGSNMPDPGPDKISMKVGVFCLIWTSIDATISDVGLNVIWNHRDHWWQLWRKGPEYVVGLPPHPQQTTSFIRSIRAIDRQPIQFQFDFEYVTDRDAASGDPHWYLEFVIRTGIPRATYAIPISLEHAFRQPVGNPPLR